MVLKVKAIPNRGFIVHQLILQWFYMDSSSLEFPPDFESIGLSALMLLFNKIECPKTTNLKNFGYVWWIYGWKHIFAL